MSAGCAGRGPRGICYAHAVQRRHALAAGLALTALAGAAWLGIATAGDPAPPAAADPASVLAQAVERGRHVRVEGPRGPIHAWIPAGYRAETAATIVYVHGYWDTADSAWTAHQLPQQFSLSALNALFIVPEAPVMAKTPINYPDLGEVIRRVEDAAGMTRGAALTVAVGHSGAHRTVYAWLDEPLLDQLVLIDALYGEEDPLLAWYRAAPHRRLITVGQDTVLGTESLAMKLPETLLVDRFPPQYDLWPAAAKTARHVYVRAQFGHMPLVTDGIALPSLLRLLPVERLADQPWQLPLGSLPPLPDAAAPGDGSQG